MFIKGLLYTIVSLLLFVRCASEDIFYDNIDDESPDVPNEEVTPILLSGEIIGTRYSVDYSTSNRSESVNTKDCVFDGNFNT